MMVADCIASQLEIRAGVSVHRIGAVSRCARDELVAAAAAVDGVDANAAGEEIRAAVAVMESFPRPPKTVSIPKS